MKRCACIILVSIGVLCILAASGQATKLVYRSPKDLATESSNIVRGTVASVSSYWNAERTKIYTEARIAVDETYKGGPIREARVIQLGGIVGHVNMHVEGALGWKPNEEVLLFLEPNAAGTFSVAGFSQGKFDIVRDAKTGKAFVAGVDLDDVEVVGEPAPAPPAGQRKVTLDRFINETLDRR
jgi:hypothetical protein